MEEALLKLLQNSPWVALAVGLVWQIIKTQGVALDAYKAGVESTRQQRESLDNAVKVLQSLETRQANIESALVYIKAGLSR